MKHRHILFPLALVLATGALFAEQMKDQNTSKTDPVACATDGAACTPDVKAMKPMTEKSASCCSPQSGCC